MVRKIDGHRDWRLLPVVVLTGLVVGSLFGCAVQVLGPPLAAMVSNPARLSR